MKKTAFALALVMALASSAAIACPGGKHGGGHMIEKMDTNKDGAVSKDEAMAFHGQKFDEMDADKDGKLTKEEGKAFMEKKKAEWEAKRADKKAAEGTVVKEEVKQ
jgi:hypothetical protein